MKKIDIDNMNPDATVECPECKQQMKQYGIGGFNMDLVFVCENEDCKFLGLPRMVKFFLEYDK